VEGSVCLTAEEKEKIVDDIPRLSQFQIDELLRIWNEEKTEIHGVWQYT